MNTGPVFVKIERHREMMETLEAVKRKVHEAKDALNKINDLKAQEDHEIEQWKAELSKIEEKIDFIEDSMSKEG